METVLGISAKVLLCIHMDLLSWETRNDHWSIVDTFHNTGLMLCVTARLFFFNR